MHLAHERGMCLRFFSDEEIMESQHFANITVVHGPGYYGSVLGQGPSIMRTLAATAFTPEYLEGSPSSNATSANDKAARRHSNQAERHQEALGRPTPCAIPRAEPDEVNNNQIRHQFMTRVLYISWNFMVTAKHCQSCVIWCVSCLFHILTPNPYSKKTSKKF